MYDDASRLTCVNCRGADKLQYAYDGAGARVSATRGTLETLEFTDHAGWLLVEYTPRANQLVEHVHVAGQRISQRVSKTGVADELTYFHLDPLGSPVAASDATGLLAWKEAYRPFGFRQIRQPDSADNHVYYTGRYTEGRLAHHGARYYDPWVGRFMGVDPLAFATANPLMSVNRYAYANNNPYRFVDPSGFEPWGPGSTYESDDSEVSQPSGGGSLSPQDLSAQLKPRDIVTNRPGDLGAGGASGGALLGGSIGNALRGAGVSKLDQDEGSGAKTPEDLMGEATKGRETKGRADQYNHEGGREQRDKDFDSLGATDVKDRGNGTKTGTLPDGRPVNVHDSKTDGVPTIQVGNGSREIKIRYP